MIPDSLDQQDSQDSLLCLQRISGDKCKLLPSHNLLFMANFDSGLAIVFDGVLPLLQSPRLFPFPLNPLTKDANPQKQNFGLSQLIFGRFTRPSNAIICIHHRSTTPDSSAIVSHRLLRSVYPLVSRTTE